MLKEKRKLIQNFLMITDVAFVLLAFILAYQIRLLPYFQNIKKISQLNSFFWLAWIALPLFLILLYFHGLYHSLRTITYGSLIWRIFKIVLAGTLILTSLIFLFKAKDFSRSLVALFSILNFTFLIGYRIGLKWLAQAARKRGYNFRNVLIIGVNQRTINLINRIQSHPEWNFKITGLMTLDQSVQIPQNLPSNIPVLGSIDQLDRITREHIIDEIIFSLDKYELSSVESAFLLCEELGIKTHLVADFFNFLIAKTEIGYLQDIPILTFTTTPSHEFHLVIKRLVDLIFSVIFFIVTIPLMLLISLLIKIDSKGAVLYKQTRVGLNGRTFQLLKFRSMLKEADEMKADIQDLNVMSGPVFKASNDPRITRIGRFIRKYSLDELPQLINILKNDMSLVGPRPPIPEEVEKYEQWQRRRLSMKPGLTCIWQISGRNKIDFEEWMKLDLQYIDQWSLGLDMKIIIKTIPAVLGAKGAN